MKTSTWFKRLLVIAVLSTLALARGETALQRPCIWANAEDKARIQKVIAEQKWAASRLDDMKRNVASHLARHQASPADYLKKSVPEIPGGPHIRSLNLALEAGVLYFMTENEDYARLAADILNVYVQRLSNETNEVVISGGPARDYWDFFPMVGLTYDFIHPFLAKPGVTVFDKESGKRIPYDEAKTQRMFERVVKTGFESWIEGSNHTIMEGAGILYCVLAIEDQQKRDAHIQTFLKGSKPKTGLLWMKQVLLDNHGVWPESTSYSSLGSVTYKLMEAVDRVYPEVKIYKGCEQVLTGFSDRLFYKYPGNEETVCFGDAHRSAEGSPRLSPAIIRFVRRAGLEAEAKALLCQIQADRQKYGESAKVSHSSRGGNWVHDEFLTLDTLAGYEPKRIESQAVVLPYAGIVIQKNLPGEDSKEHGMMYYTGGAHYVHSHCSGLDFEIFGAGYVMGGVGGMYSPRSAATFNDYYRNYAGHNTVVVNGISHGDIRGFWGQQKLSYMDTTRMEAMEPKPYTPAVAKDFTFSSQILDDTVNHATQQRLVSIVRTSGTTGYYFDLFRSRAQGENKCHDYLYHNLGDRLALRQAGGAELPLTAAPARYPSYPVTRYRVNPEEKTSILRFTSPTDNGGKYEQSLTVRFPGWHYFTHIMTSAATAESVAGTFFVDALKRYVHVAMPGGFEREYTACQAPPISDAVEPYTAIAKEGSAEKSHAQVLSIRQPGEAWNRPFIVIYEASASKQPTVQSVEHILDAGRVVGAKVVSQVGKALITDWIIAQENDKATLDERTSGIQFRGRFAIVRTVERGADRELTLYIGDGSQLSFHGHELKADDTRKGLLSKTF